MFHIVQRQQHLNAFRAKLQQQHGDLFAIYGGPGLGKSTLMHSFQDLLDSQGRAYLFLNLEDLNPAHNAADLLADFACLDGSSSLKAFKTAAEKYRGVYQDSTAVLALYGDAFKQAGTVLEEHSSHDDTPTQDTTDNPTLASLKGLAGVAMAAWQARQKSKVEKEQHALGHPENYLLDALARSCAQHPVILVDTYEHLFSHPTLAGKTLLSSVYFAQGKRRPRVGDKAQAMLLSEWLDGCLHWLAAQGALVVVAGRDPGNAWTQQGLEVPRFSAEDMLEVAQHAGTKVQQAARQPHSRLPQWWPWRKKAPPNEQCNDLQAVLRRLSFDGNPLWLRVGLNMLEEVLNEGEDLHKLANDEAALHACFEADENPTNATSHEHYSCKISLFQHVTRHLPTDLDANAWRMALPRRLDADILQVMFGEQAKTLQTTYARAGLLPMQRRSQSFRLHEEVRDLLLAYARSKQCLNTPDTLAVHQRLAAYFVQRHASDKQAIHLLEAAYHQLMGLEAPRQHSIDPEFYWQLLAQNVRLSPLDTYQHVEAAHTWDKAQWQASLNDLAEEKRTLEAEFDKETLVQLQQHTAQGKAWDDVNFWQAQVEQDNQGAWFYLGVALGQLQRYEEAIKAYAQAVQIKPDYHQAWNNKGAALGQLQRYEEAIAAYEQAVRIKPDKHEAWYNKGIVLDGLQRYEEAIAAYAQAVRIKPDFHQAWYNKGFALGQLQRYEEAIAAYEQAVRIQPDKHEAWNNKGTALYQLQRYEEAIAAYEQAVQIKPDDHQAWYGKGVALHQLQRYEEAIAAYAQAVQIKPDYHEAWNNKGTALWKVGDLNTAAMAYAQVLQLKPDDLTALANDAELALVQEDTARCAERIAAAQSLLHRDDQHYAILPFLAWLAQPQTGWQAVLQAIEGLDTGVKLTWDFSDTQPAIARLPEPEREQATAFVAFFEGDLDLAVLRQRLVGWAKQSVPINGEQNNGIEDPQP